MTLRIIVRTDDANMAGHVAGGSAHTNFKTFDVSAPEVEEFLNESLGSYAHRYVVGVEVIDPANGGAQ